MTKRQKKETYQKKEPVFQILDRDKLVKFFSDFRTIDQVYKVSNNFSQREKDKLALTGCFALPIKIIAFLTGNGAYCKMLSGMEVSEMVGLVEIIIQDELWNKCDPARQLEIRSKLSLFQIRFATNAYKVKK